jgi:ubiquitin-conjugating enzyme E2 G1
VEDASHIKNVSRLTTSLLRTQLKALADGAVDGVEVWLPDDDLLHWGLTIEGPPDTLYEGALFRAELSFPVSYPDQPPEMRFTGVVPYHPNVYPDGRVCISILHAPGENAAGELGFAPTDEPESEKWRPVLGVDSVVVSVVSMLSDPNCNSPANVEAGVLWREDRAQFKKKVLKCVAASIEQ